MLLEIARFNEKRYFSRFTQFIAQREDNLNTRYFSRRNYIKTKLNLKHVGHRKGELYVLHTNKPYSASILHILRHFRRARMPYLDAYMIIVN